MRTPEEYDAMLDLPAQEKIRAAEQLMREEHRVIGDPDYLFWGELADQFNATATIPDLTNQRPRDTREFNRFQTMAIGYIERSARLARERQEARS